MSRLLFKKINCISFSATKLVQPRYNILNNVKSLNQRLQYSSDSNITDLPKSSIPLADSVILRMSDKCVERILYTQKRDNNPKQALRVIIESGGCHGFKISFDITDKYTKDDVIFEKNGAKVVTNKAYLPLIGGSEVDFETELIGSTFRLFNNPNAASGCGCGISFELK